VSACPGGAFNTSLPCGVGYTGPLCAVCELGYFKSSGSMCEECGVGDDKGGVVSRRANAAVNHVRVETKLIWLFCPVVT
jgi:hypothetical protein